MIREVIETFRQRINDLSLIGRNGARLVLGTDRKNTITSGYGSGGKNERNSAAIDIVAGVVSGDPSFDSDASRVYLSEKSDPDDYFGVNKGSTATGEACVGLKSDNVYVVARERIKLIRGSVCVIIDDD